MAGKTKFNARDFEILEQAMHRLQRMRDYSVPNGIQYFGVPSENDNARNSLAEITNQLHDYTGDDTEEPFQPRLHSNSRNRILYFLKESDGHINRANRQAGVKTRVANLFDEVSALFDKMGFRTPLSEITEPSNKAAEEVRHFRRHYDPHADAKIFGDSSQVTGEIMGGALDGTTLHLPFSVDSVEFTPQRLRKMLSESKPELFIDFTQSKDSIVAAVKKVSEHDAKVVKRVLDRGQRTQQVEWGDKVTDNPVHEPLGVKWPINEWGELSNDGMKYLIKLWQEIKDKVAATRVAYDSAEEMIESLNKPAMQQKFIAKTLSSAALQTGPTPPGMRPASDGYPDH